MKAYLFTTALAFALVLIAHVLRIIEEGLRIATAPAFLLSSLASAAMCAWALVLLRRYGKSTRNA